MERALLGAGWHLPVMVMADLQTGALTVESRCYTDREAKSRTHGSSGFERRDEPVAPQVILAAKGQQNSIRTESRRR